MLPTLLGSLLLFLVTGSRRNGESVLGRVLVDHDCIQLGDSSVDMDSPAMAEQADWKGIVAASRFCISGIKGASK